jgi:hypothetical protein
MAREGLLYSSDVVVRVADRRDHTLVQVGGEPRRANEEIQDLPDAVEV